MKRRLLISVLVIGVVASAISFASFSAFNDSESASGTVTAGTVQLDDGGTVTLPFTVPAGCPGPMGQGDICSTPPIVPGGNYYRINYTGTLNAHVAISLQVVESQPGCFTVTGAAGSIATGQGGLFTLPVGGGSPNYMDPLGFPVGGGAPTETIPVLIIAALTGPNSCQGATATVTVNAVATED
jgi:predicted ribosomally synthesized peptide with SipW-like signal peptide